ncbi:hypothetical protein [Terracidiphilus sp.]|uniref:hypothetical protein n=1 Tax=Terracidiphilus sp. TaxID=1964191 RepID=UPI003C130CCB
MERIVGEDSSLAAVAPLYLYQRDDLFKLEYLAFVLNNVPKSSSAHHVVELIERLVSTPPEEQAWVKVASPDIGPAPCTPAPGSPLYALNKFLETNPCILRIEGLERANDNIAVHATHISFSIVEGANAVEVDRILWVLWEVYYRAIDLTRLKRCPICHTWFVDHTKNKQKTRCSIPCTNKKWSWAERKKAGHHMSGSDRKTKKGKP